MIDWQKAHKEKDDVKHWPDHKKKQALGFMNQPHGTTYLTDASDSEMVSLLLALVETQAYEIDDLENDMREHDARG